MNRRSFFGGLLGWVAGLFGFGAGGTTQEQWKLFTGKIFTVRVPVPSGVKFHDIHAPHPDGKKCKVCGRPATLFGTVCQSREDEPYWDGKDFRRATLKDSKLHHFCDAHKPSPGSYPRISLPADHWSKNPVECEKRLALLRAIGVKAGKVTFDEEAVSKIGLVWVIPVAAENLTFDRYEIRQPGS